MKTFPKKKETASLPAGTPAGSKAAPNFMDVVYGIVRRIPRGRATSYGAIAEASGIRLTARMVGWAMNAAGRAQPPVPAHRVVNSKGELSGRAHFSTPTLMQELLEHEGITVKNDRIENFSKVFWDPGASENIDPAAKKPVAKRSAGTPAAKRKAPVTKAARPAPPATRSTAAAKNTKAARGTTKPGTQKPAAKRRKEN